MGVELLEPRTLLACDSTSSTLCASDVEKLLMTAANATPSKDAIIAVVDRGGHILGVRVEQDVLDTYDANDNGTIDPGSAEERKLVFAIDGAIAKARTAAFFANDEAPLTSRTVQFISQTTITEREVRSNPNITDADSPLRGPGFVAEIGIHGHFPPGVRFTPQVDLFAIEHTNRDSIVHPGADHIRGLNPATGTNDDILLTARFDAQFDSGKEIDPPESYGFVSGRLPSAQARGIATLPGGIPIYKDTNLDGLKPGDPLVGGIGVFFPGPDGYATYEQGLDPGRCQVPARRQGVNAPCVLEAEFIAAFAVTHADTETTVDPTVLGVTRLRGRLDLVGITLDTVGPHGLRGLNRVLRYGRRLGAGVDNGTNQFLPGAGATNTLDGEPLPEGWLVSPRDGIGLTASEVQTIIEQGIIEADRVRAAIRLPFSRTTKMMLAVTDTNGDVLGLYRMHDATFFSIDVSVAKGRNVAYYADATSLQAADRVDDNHDSVPDASVPAGTAFSNRTFRFLALPRFPEGIDGTRPGAFSIVNDGGVNRKTGRTVGAPLAASAFTSVQGFDAFNPGTNFHDPNDIKNQNGIVFFPGSTPIYKNGVLVGGFGASGDGVDQDDVVTAFGAYGFLPPSAVKRADDVKVRNIRLPFIKFLRNPEGRT